MDLMQILMKKVVELQILKRYLHILLVVKKVENKDIIIK